MTGRMTKWMDEKDDHQGYYTSGCPWPSDTVKSPGFFKPKGTHKGAKQPFKKKKEFVMKIR
jgi:hypothetical protein